MPSASTPPSVVGALMMGVVGSALIVMSTAPQGRKSVTCMPIGLPQRNITDAICRADGVLGSWLSRKRIRPAAVQPKNSSVIRMNSGSRMADDQAI